MYIVKSGYWFGVLGKPRHDDDLIDDVLRKLWVMIWKIAAPLKLRHFLWRACRESLATKQVLFNRYCVDSPFVMDVILPWNLLFML